MRRIKLWFAVILSIILFYTATPAWALHIGIDGEALDFDVPPETNDGLIYVPIQSLTKKIGADLHQDGDVFIISKSNCCIELVCGKQKATIRISLPQLPLGRYMQVMSRLPYMKSGISVLQKLLECKDFTYEQELSGVPYLKNRKLMLPLSFLSEQLDCVVEYESDVVRIILPGQPIDGEPIYSMKLEKSSEEQCITIRTKDIINTCIYMIYEGQGAEVAPPAKYTPLDLLGSIYSFYNRTGDLVAKWQFVHGEGNQIYLYNMVKDCWYLADSSIYYQAFDDDGGMLELKLTGYWGGKGSWY